MRKTFFCIDSHACGNPVRVVAVHSEDPTIQGVHHAIWCDAPKGAADGRGAVFYSEKPLTAHPAAPEPRPEWRSFTGKAV